ncbi:hypothetical protein CASFOL_011761 [Castilleja foliolosa]|uniref:Calcium uniporter protein C-terminal domain-containing protein n=1 Tax=Castilleja foliolosa TaxID=1961234 RepID=A0ABD3DPQ5_9LAMI
MSFNRMIGQRLFPALKNRRLFSPSTAVESSTATFNRLTVPKRIEPEPGDDGIFRRHLHLHTAAAASPGSGWLHPAREKPMGKLCIFDVSRERIKHAMVGLAAVVPAESPEGKLTVADAKNILRLSEIEEMKLKLRQNEKDCVSYSEFKEICENECSSKDQSMELAKILDQSGCVIVLGNIVFLRPEKVIKAIGGVLMPIIPQNCNDPRTNALEEMEKQKSTIDEKAKLHVRRELWCGLGYLLVQTTIFMRLTFWDLSWDVMEPICFYITSMYFMGGYAFFLRTSKEPSFEGLYKSRLSARRRRLMKVAGFDVERYNELSRACYPHSWESRMFK